MAVTPPSRAPELPFPTLGDLVEQVAADPSLSSRQRQDISSALRSVARAIGRRPEEIPARPRHLQQRLAKITPAMTGVSAGRWANVVSLTRTALKRAGLTTIPGRSSEPLAAEWQDLFRFLNHRRQREALSRFARHASSLGINPSDVDDDVSAAFLTALEDEALVRNPRGIHRAMCVAWNKASETVPGWPSLRLRIPQYREDYSLPWEALPSSLGAEAQAYFDRLAGRDLLAELDFKPLRGTSIASYDRLLRAYLSALVLRGAEKDSLQSLRDIVAVETVKTGLRFFIDRAGGEKSRQAYHIARTLTAIARHWVRVNQDHLDQLRTICRRLDPGKMGLADKNRERLRQFDDPANVHALLALPQRVFDRHVRKEHPTPADALAMQSALAVELLVMTTMRIGNLAALSLDQNIVRAGTRRSGAVHVVVPGEDVKNGTAIEAMLPPESARLLDAYLTRFRPLLQSEPTPALFPGRGAGSKARNTLANQVKKFVLRECGLKVNVHLFRHIAAKLYLEAHPGAYGVIRLVHGHRSVETTTRHYCGTENTAAMRHYDEHVLRLRRQSALPANGSRHAGGRRR